MVKFEDISEESGGKHDGATPGDRRGQATRSRGGRADGDGSDDGDDAAARDSDAYVQSFILTCGDKDPKSGTYVLSRFPAESNPYWIVTENVECSQTMDFVDIVYKLHGADAELTEEEITVEISDSTLHVSHGDKAYPVRTELPLGGEFFQHRVKPKLARWMIQDSDGERMLCINIPKEEHKAWKALWFVGDRIRNHNRKQRFSWRPEGPSRDEARLISIPGKGVRLEDGPDPNSVSTDHLERLVLGIEEKQKDQSYEAESNKGSVSKMTMYIHFKKSEFEEVALKAQSTPLSELLGAKISAKKVEVLLKWPSQWTIFEGETTDEIIPHQTTWKFEPARAIKELNRDHAQGPTVDHYNPALKITMTRKTPVSREEVNRRKVFARSTCGLCPSGSVHHRFPEIIDDEFLATKNRLLARCRDVSGKPPDVNFGQGVTKTVDPAEEAVQMREQAAARAKAAARAAQARNLSPEDSAEAPSPAAARTPPARAQRPARPATSAYPAAPAGASQAPFDPRIVAAKFKELVEQGVNPKQAANMAVELVKGESKLSTKVGSYK